MTAPSSVLNKKHYTKLMDEIQIKYGLAPAESKN